MEEWIMYLSRKRKRAKSALRNRHPRTSSNLYHLQSTPSRQTIRPLQGTRIFHIRQHQQLAAAGLSFILSFRYEKFPVITNIRNESERLYGCSHRSMWNPSQRIRLNSWRKASSRMVYLTRVPLWNEMANSYILFVNCWKNQRTL